MAMGLGLASLIAAAVATTQPPPEPKGRAAFFPLPMYTTVPNEGSTYGLMPVFVGIAPAGNIFRIFAPSVSWNKAAGINATLRYYGYPRREDAYSVVAAASTKFNRTLLLHYAHLPQEAGYTLELNGVARRNIFFRFFGLGPDSTKAAESSYARTTVLATARVGINLPAHFNAGLRLTIRGDNPIERAIFGLPVLHEKHPDAPGLEGAAMAMATASIRYDTRDGGDYAQEGVAVEVGGAYANGLDGFDRFWQLTTHARALLMETSFLQGAGRVSFNHTLGGHDVPFYYQSSLGGEVLLRGFPNDRFIDRGAWEIEVEQRFRVLRTRMFGVTTDWRIDPFVAAGQVFPRLTQMFSHPRLTAGIGLRAWVHPNVLGRVDVAYGGDGLQAYVVLGYPY